MSGFKKILGQTAIYGLSTMFVRALNFLLTPIYVRSYAVTGYGVLSTLFSWASILNALLAFGMETTFFRYINKKADKHAVYNNGFFMVALLAGLFLVITFMLSKPIASGIQIGNLSYLPDYVYYVKLFAFILTLDALAVIPFAKIRADEKAFRYSYIKLINIGLFISFNLFFIFIAPYWAAQNWPLSQWISSWLRPDWIGYVLVANLIASLATLLLLLPELRQLNLRFNKQLCKEMLGYSWPLLGANLSFIINENLDKIALGKLLPITNSEQAVGIYSACGKLAIFLSIFVQAFRLGIEPFFFSHSKATHAKENYAFIMRYFVIAIAVIVVALTANIEIIKYFIKVEDPDKQALYWSGLGVVPILLMSYACLGIYMNLSVWYKLSDKTKYGLYISGIGALITIVLNCALIPTFGYFGSAWVSFIAYASMMVLSFLLGQKHYPIPYQLPVLWLYLGLASLLVLLIFVVFKRNIWIGNVLLLLFVGMILKIERNRFAKIKLKNSK